MLSFVANEQILFFLLIILFAITIIIGYYTANTTFRLKRLFKGSSIKDLEKSLVTTEKEIASLRSFREETEKQLKHIAEKVQKGSRGIGVVRFNPFGKKDGGNQSFSAAFVNQDGNGVVLSSLSIRDRVTIFAKPLTRNESELGLSAEEKKAVQKAHE
ncbi:MAG: DUF4446 family protein [Parcubacteria group bacterium]|nr:DUF4446 family protein [Parcubacteria group bacterium]